jgi:hypothetical protein
MTGESGVSLALGELYAPLHFLFAIPPAKHGSACRSWPKSDNFQSADLVSFSGNRRSDETAMPRQPLISTHLPRRIALKEKHHG